jgi:uncharacterized repeat protein (TIGR03803 family)
VADVSLNERTVVNNRIKNLLLLPILAVALASTAAFTLSAQTFSNLYNFSALPGLPFPYPGGDNSDGANPYAGLILSGETLYGTSLRGGTAGNGTVFAINTNGTGFTNLHSFASPYPPQANTDGSRSYGALLLAGKTLFGTTLYGGSAGVGAIFAVNTNGTGFTNLFSFASAEPNSPYGGLILAGPTLYGTASAGGAGGNGAVFAINTNGTGFTVLHSFTATAGDAGYNGDGTNSDGSSPADALIISGNTLYGTAQYGGLFGNGTVFALNTNGSGFTNLHSFTGTNDGASPEAGLLLSGPFLYGTTLAGGLSGDGTVFGVKTNGAGFTNLYSFTNGSDGSEPYDDLVILGNTLYGTVSAGCESTNGGVFALNTSGGDFTNVYSFSALPGVETGTNADGAVPFGGLVLSGDTLYGTAQFGGGSENGTVFSLFLESHTVPQAPPLTITLSGQNVILSWPTNSSGNSLQSTTNLNRPVTWSLVTPGPVVVNGQNWVTNRIAGAEKFYQITK